MKVGGNKNNFVFLMFVLPGAIYMATMILIPIGYNIILGFKNVDMLNFLNKGCRW